MEEEEKEEVDILEEGEVWWRKMRVEWQTAQHG